MKKSELKTGMRVTLKDGSICVVFLNSTLGEDGIVDLNDDSWMSLNEFAEGLTVMDGSNSYLDVIRVEVPEYKWDIINKKASMRLLWERGTQRMTLKEIEDALGYKINLVEEKENEKE